MLPVTQQNKDLVAEPIWIDQNGGEHEIKKMKTDHLYNCVNMLWNNTMPVKTKKEYKEWHFPRFKNNRQELFNVLAAMVDELATRRLTAYQMRGLQIMDDFIRGRNLSPVEELVHEYNSK